VNRHADYARSYAGNVVRTFEANVNASHRDYGRKTSAFFKYAAYDEYMVSATPSFFDPADKSEVPKP
jgi:hypothetical protein